MDGLNQSSFNSGRWFYWAFRTAEDAIADLLPDWYAPLGGNVQEIRVVVIQRGTVPVELLLEAQVSAVHVDEVEFKAQVAYQQGKTIAHNLKAISEGGSPSSDQASLRETLLKLGLEESVAEIFDRFEVKGKLGPLVRQATYLELLPTPVRNFKSTTEWLTDEVFHRVGHV